MLNRGYSYRGANLHKVLADRLAVIHGIKRRNLVDAHRRHLQQSRYLVHNADTGVAMLALTKVQKGHNSSLLVLRGVAFKDLVDEFEVLVGKLERKSRVIGGRIAVLDR